MDGQTRKKTQEEIMDMLVGQQHSLKTHVRDSTRNFRKIKMLLLNICEVSGKER